MAAIRSTLAMLGRRSCGSSASSAAASFGGRGLEIHHVFRPAAPRAPPLPSLRPAGRNLESFRLFSTAGREQSDKSEGHVRMWWQRWSSRVKNLDAVQQVTLSFGYANVVIAGSAIYKMN